MSRHAVRLVGAAAAAIMALVYFGIGAGALQVVDPPAAEGEMLFFGATAGAAFLLGAVLLTTLDRPILWVMGALFQVIVAVMYVVVAQQRTPPFEVWGITLRLLQVPLFAVLVYLAVRSPAAGSARA
jgi:hypothetical protein